MPCGGLQTSKPEWGDAVVSDPTGTVLSVRGDARRTVPPDYVVLFSTVTVVRESTAQALRVAASAVDRITADLASLGGVALDVASGRRPLTWSTRSATTSEQGDLNKQTGRYDPTGQVSATVAVVITVREFDMLDSLGAALAAHDALAVQSVGWHVDPDNPAWPVLRATAIHAAIAKAGDYAAALGGKLRHVDHIADVGLLGGGDNGRYSASSDWVAQRTSLSGEQPSTPSLDPVPQELTATIDARFTATEVSLTQQ